MGLSKHWRSKAQGNGKAERFAMHAVTKLSTRLAISSEMGKKKTGSSPEKAKIGYAPNRWNGGEAGKEEITAAGRIHQ